jgi:PAS domain S-box-containing protein
MEKAYPDDVAFKSQSWLSNLEAMTSHDVNCRLQGADGAYRWFNIRGEPLRDSDGSVRSWHGVFIEVDNQKTAEEKSRESELKLRQIIETLPALIWSSAPDGEPTHFNQRILDYDGKQFEDFKHLGRRAFVHPDDLPEHEKALSHAIQTETAYQFVSRIRRADGEYRWHQGRVSLCAISRDASSSGMAWLLTLMKPGRLKTYLEVFCHPRAAYNTFKSNAISRQVKSHRGLRAAAIEHVA